MKAPSHSTSLLSAIALLSPITVTGHNAIGESAPTAAVIGVLP